MRRGLMKWDEAEFSVEEAGGRVARLRAAMAERGLDAFIAYTTLVRPAAVHYLTGFTPYWSDGVLIVAGDGQPVFITALSKRVGKWLGGVNPTSAILHAPRPGRKAAEVLAQKGVRRLGLLEPDMMPGELVEDLKASAQVEIADASDLFAAVRAVPTESERRLARHAEEIARRAFAELSSHATTVGEITGPLERAVRWQAAEECYTAIAPDLSRDTRLARHHGSQPLGEIFAARVSVAYHGVWIRFARTLRRGGTFSQSQAALERIAAGLDLSRPVAGQLADAAGAAGLTLASWMIEAPFGTRPLKHVAGQERPGPLAVPYGILSITGQEGGEPFAFSTLVPAKTLEDESRDASSAQRMKGKAA